jgi:hypothetical protein
MNPQGLYLLVFLLVSALLLFALSYLFPHLFLKLHPDLEEGRPGLLPPEGKGYGIESVFFNQGKLEIHLEKDTTTIDADVLCYSEKAAPFKILNVAYHAEENPILSFSLPSKTTHVRVVVRERNGLLYSSHPIRGISEKALTFLAFLDGLSVSVIALMMVPCFIGFRYGELQRSYFAYPFFVLFHVTLSLALGLFCFFLFRAFLVRENSVYRTHGGLKA